MARPNEYFKIWLMKILVINQRPPEIRDNFVLKIRMARPNEYLRSLIHFGRPKSSI